MYTPAVLFISYVKMPWYLIRSFNLQKIEKEILNMEGAYCFPKINTPEIYLDKVILIGFVNSLFYEPYFFVYYKDRPRQKIFVSKKDITKKLKQEADQKNIINQEELKRWKISILKECRLWLYQNLKRKRQIRKESFKKE